MATSQSHSYVTLITSDSYVIGACVLGHSLRRAKTDKLLTVLITKRISQDSKSQLKEVFDIVQTVDEIDSGDSGNLALLGRPELGNTFTKIQAWTLTDFEKCVFLDADTLVLKNIDDLFLREGFCAAPDVGWPDCFNSGVFVYTPSMKTFGELQSLASTVGSFDGGDQGLLNQYFKDWNRISFVYNMTSNSSYGYAPAFKQFQEDVKVVHFIGAQKPWLGMPHPGAGMEAVVLLVEKWWRAYDDYHASCSSSCDYKTLMGVRGTRSPGPEKEVRPQPTPPSIMVGPPSISQNIAKPSTTYMTTSSFADVQAMIDRRLQEPPTVWRQRVADEEEVSSSTTSSLPSLQDDFSALEKKNVPKHDEY